MYHLDESTLPIVIFEFQGQQSLVDHQTMMDDFSKLLNRQQPLVVVRRFHDMQALEQQKDVGKMTMIWLKQGAKQKIIDYVAGMVFVVPKDAYDKKQHLSVEAVFGVPGKIFYQLDDAKTWLNEHIDSKLLTHLDDIKTETNF